jgi:hypothetical protein
LVGRHFEESVVRWDLENAFGFLVSHCVRPIEAVPASTTVAILASLARRVTGPKQDALRLNVCETAGQQRLDQRSLREANYFGSLSAAASHDFGKGHKSRNSPSNRPCVVRDSDRLCKLQAFQSGNVARSQAIQRCIGVLKLAGGQGGREFCTVVHHANSIASAYTDDESVYCQLDRDGRLLAIPTADGIAVLDVVRGEEVALLPLGNSEPIGLEPPGAILTRGSTGVLRWPMPFFPGGIGNSADATVLAFPVSNKGARELILPEGKEFPLTHQEDVRHCAVSPDGLWVVTGSHGAIKGLAAKVWDARIGRHVRDLPVAEFCFVKFSRDGKWLLTAGGVARLWSVGTWDEGPKLANSALRGAFSADGALLALQDEPGVVRLVVPDSGKEVARLTAPETTRLVPLCFTRDMRRLVCRGGESESLCIFDLGLVRAELAPMKLDWDAPSYPAEGDAVPAPLAVRVVGADKIPGP